MFKFVKNIFFKIPFIKEEIRFLKNDGKQWKNAHESLRTDYFELKDKFSKLDKQFADYQQKIALRAFVYIDLEDIYKKEQWTCIDGPCKNRIEVPSSDVTHISIAVVNEAAFSSSKLFGGDLEIKNHDLYFYHKIRIVKDNKEKYFWKWDYEF